MSIPVNVIFSPAWWHGRYGISFEEPFYLDVETRIANDVRMRRALYETFGIGEPEPQPRPVIGSMYIAGGYVIAGLLGVPIRFRENLAAWSVPLELDREAVMAMRAPELATTWPMNVLMGQMDELEKRFGYVCGDLDTAGIFNTGVDVRGNALFLDLVDDPELTDHLFDVIASTTVAVSRYLRARTGTTSISVNRSITSLDRSLHVLSNCSVSMLSPKLYEQRVRPFDQRVADELEPLGIHHCGGNAQRYAEAYLKLRPKFLDVGSGSDLAVCDRLYPETFLNLRVSPVRMLNAKAEAIYVEVLEMLRYCGRRENVGVCCINMDGETPDDNVRAMFRAAADYERETPGR